MWWLFVPKQCLQTADMMLCHCNTRYMYQETLGRWHAIDLFFGLAYLSRRDSQVYPASDIAAAGRPISTNLSLQERTALLEQLRQVRRYMLYCQGLRHHKPALQRKHWKDSNGLGEQHYAQVACNGAGEQHYAQVACNRTGSAEYLSS